MDIENILKNFANISYVPITLYNNGIPTFNYPTLPYLSTIVSQYPQQLLKCENNVNCIVTSRLLFFGMVKVKKTSMVAIFGPISEMQLNNERAKALLDHYKLPLTQTGDAINYFQTTPRMSVSKFASILTFANYVINNDNIKSSDILPSEYKLAETVNNQNDAQLNQINIAAPSFHDSLSYEQELFSYVHSGNYYRLKEYLKEYSYHGNEGVLSDSTLQHQKYLLVSSVILAGRSAFYGGLDYETAMSNSDYFIQQIDRAASAKELALINNTMLISFTKLVSERKIGNPNSAIASKVHRYIELNLTKKISVQDMAQNLGLNRSYLSVQFKKETGVNISDFINKLKIDEAKRLLKISDKPTVYISNLLDFSSQSYFQNVFKKFTGLTPKEYKNLDSPIK